MGSKLFALGAAALALLLILSAVDPAEARRGHGGHGARSYGGSAHRWGPSRFGSHHHRHHHHRHHHHRRLFIGVPLAYGYYDYGYGYGGCHWLRSRALHTGSRYWWNRYHACINGY